MPPKFIFIRHGEADHNVAFRENNRDESVFLDEKYRDAPLTSKGIQEAKTTGIKLSERKILDIWSSPLTRCIQTAEEIFEETGAQDMYLHDSLLERLGGGHYCNERKSKQELKTKYNYINVKHLPEFGPLWIERENQTALFHRMLSFVLLLSSLYEKVPETLDICIVSHKDAIVTLTGKELQNAEPVILTLDEILERWKPSEKI